MRICYTKTSPYTGEKIVYKRTEVYDVDNLILELERWLKE